jgi:hypothetical protein
VAGAVREALDLSNTTDLPTRSAKRFQLKTRSLGAVGLALFHLFMIGCGALMWPVRPQHGVTRLLQSYAAWSGTGGDYAFYSNLRETTIGRISSINQAEEASSHDIGRTNSEIDLRLNSMLDSIVSVEDADSCAHALAAYELGTKTYSRSVTIQFYWYRVPSMAEYRNGDRPSLEEFYRAEFVRQNQ